MDPVSYNRPFYKKKLCNVLYWTKPVSQGVNFFLMEFPSQHDNAYFWSGNYTYNRPLLAFWNIGNLKQITINLKNIFKCFTIGYIFHLQVNDTFNSGDGIPIFV